MKNSELYNLIKFQFELIESGCCDVNEATEDLKKNILTLIKGDFNKWDPFLINVFVRTLVRIDDKTCARVILLRYIKHLEELKEYNKVYDVLLEYKDILERYSIANHLFRAFYSNDALSLLCNCNDLSDEELILLARIYKRQGRYNEALNILKLLSSACEKEANNEIEAIKANMNATSLCDIEYDYYHRNGGELHVGDVVLVKENADPQLIWQIDNKGEIHTFSLTTAYIDKRYVITEVKGCLNKFKTSSVVMINTQLSNEDLFSSLYEIYRFLLPKDESYYNDAYETWNFFEYFEKNYLSKDGESINTTICENDLICTYDRSEHGGFRYYYVFRRRGKLVFAELRTFFNDENNIPIIDKESIAIIEGTHLKGNEYIYSIRRLDNKYKQKVKRVIYE